jgi:hypothetical protein
MAAVRDAEFNASVLLLENSFVFYENTFSISEFNPYLKEKTALQHYKDQLVNAV